MIRNTDPFGLLALAILFGGTAKVTTFTLQLITDNNAFADADTYTTHTVATGGGYADKTLANNPTIALDSNIPTAVWPEQVFTFTGALTGNPTIYGWQIRFGNTVFGDTFATPFTPDTNGDILRITPKYRYGNGTPT